MAIFGFLLNGLAQVLHMALTFLIWVVVIRALISWVNPDPYNAIVRFLSSMTDPMFAYLRRFVPTFGAIDLTPLILLLIIYFIDYTLPPIMAYYASKLAPTALYIR